MAKYIFRCDASKQYERFQRDINSAVKKVLKSGVYILGSEVRMFEKEFASYIGRAYGVAVASGTDAITLALKALGIKKGEEVITSTYAPTPIPTAILLAGGIPVFADIEKDTCLIDPGEIERKIRRGIRYIIPVHIFGSVCNMFAIEKIARRNGAFVVEDAAQAHGSSWDGKRAGSLGHISCFSFYPTKNLGGYGDGGMMLADKKSIADRLKLMRNYGKKYNPFDSEIVGCNSRLDEIQAAVLRVKLRYLEEMNKDRSRLADLYKEGLKGLPLFFLKEYDNAKTNYHIMTVLCKERRDGLIKFLEGHNVQTNIYYPTPLHKMRAFRKYVNSKEKFPVSEKISRQALALPMYPELSRNDVAFIIGKIKQYFGYCQL